MSTNGIHICASEITIQHMASYYGHREGNRDGKGQTTEHWANISAGKLGKKHTREHWANIFAGNLGKNQATEHRAKTRAAYVFKRNDTWIDKLTIVKPFIVIEVRMPNKRAGDVEVRSLGQSISKNKFLEGGTNSERQQLMRTEVPLAFA